jgi:hypothetical protein
MRGLSKRAVLMELVSCTVITAYLQDNGASMLVLGPSAVGVVVQAWKSWRVLNMDREDKRSAAAQAQATKAKNNGASDNTSGDKSLQDTQAYDSYAVRVMIYLLGPPILGYSLYALVFYKHARYELRCRRAFRRAFRNAVHVACCQ